MRPLPEVIVTLLERAGYEVLLPDDSRALCCGQMWESKGDFANADRKRDELIAAFRQRSEDGALPVIVDALSCTKRTLDKAQGGLQLVDLVDFIHDQLLARLDITVIKPRVALHVGCSARHLGVESKLEAIAAACAVDVLRPDGIECCAYAGEKGLYHPEMNANALRHLREQIPSEVSEGYYANRMCELGLTHHSGISYRHVACLLEECSRPA